MSASELWLISDETNQSPSEDVRFYIHAGIIATQPAISTLSQDVAFLRARYGYRPGDELKFNARSRPNHISIDAFRDLKNDVLVATREQNVRLMACLVLHDIARNQPSGTLSGWTINTLLKGFHDLLRREGARGVAMFDHLPRPLGQAFLREKFEKGIVYKDGRTESLELIDVFSESCIGAAHIMSVVDIVVGALRYWVNQRNNNPAAEALGRLVGPLLASREVNGVRQVRGHGLLTSPRTVRHSPYALAYDEIVSRLSVPEPTDRWAQQFASAPQLS